MFSHFCLSCSDTFVCACCAIAQHTKTRNFWEKNHFSRIIETIFNWFSGIWVFLLEFVTSHRNINWSNKFYAESQQYSNHSMPIHSYEFTVAISIRCQIFSTRSTNTCTYKIVVKWPINVCKWCCSFKPCAASITHRPVSSSANKLHRLIKCVDRVLNNSIHTDIDGIERVC